MNDTIATHSNSIFHSLKLNRQIERLDLLARRIYPNKLCVVGVRLYKVEIP